MLFFYCDYGLSLLGGRPKHPSTIGGGIVLLSRCNALYTGKKIDSFELVQVSLCVFPVAVLRQHALIYTYCPFVRLQKYHQEEILGQLLQYVTEQDGGGSWAFVNLMQQKTRWRITGATIWSIEAVLKKLWAQKLATACRSRLKTHASVKVRTF